MVSARWVCVSLAAFLLAAATTGCGVVDPCAFRADVGMDGRWDLVLVDGNPIPAAGYPLPFPSTDRLKSGSLWFQTKDVPLRSSCDADGVIESRGDVVALYAITTSSGTPKPSKQYAGTFVYEHRNGVVTLKAFNNSIDGDRFGDEFSVKPSIPLVGTYTLTFQRATR